MIKDFKTYATPKGWIIQMDLDDGSYHSMVVDRGMPEAEYSLIESGMQFFLRVLREKQAEIQAGREQGAAYRLICPKCGAGNQIFINPATGKLTCHRAFCHTVIEEPKK